MIPLRLSFSLPIAALLLCSCSTRQVGRTPPPPAPPQNYFSNQTVGLPMRRVAVLPLASARVSPEALREVAEAFQSELTKKALFEVATVSASDLESICGQRQLSSVEPLPANVLSRLRERFGAEGVLLTDITHFNSYRPVSIGVRTKLVDVTNGQIRWAFDYVYDAGHPVVAEAARQFQKEYSDARRAIPDDGGSILLSPARFAKYVAAETYSSLQKDQ